MGWYTDISRDISNIPDAVVYFEGELTEARTECKLSGNVERAAASMPGIVEHRFGQLQEIEAILEYLNIELRRLRSQHFRKYLENYQRSLSSKDCEKYVDGEDEVIDFETIINEVALLRNRYLGIMKAMESKNFMLGHIVRLRAAGMEDIQI